MALESCKMSCITVMFGCLNFHTTKQCDMFNKLLEDIVNAMESHRWSCTRPDRSHPRTKYEYTTHASPAEDTLLWHFYPKAQGGCCMQSSFLHSGMRISRHRVLYSSSWLLTIAGQQAKFLPGVIPLPSIIFPLIEKKIGHVIVLSRQHCCKFTWRPEIDKMKRKISNKYTYN